MNRLAKWASHLSRQRNALPFVHFGYAHTRRRPVDQASRCIGTLVPTHARRELPALVRRHTRSGADEGSRTPGLDLGKVALYQLSYIRKMPG